MKRCPRCKAEVALSEFSSTGYCKPCNRARVREWQAKNPKKVKATQARTRDLHRVERRKKELARYHRLMAEDPERIRKLRREWAQTNKGVLANRSARHKRRGAAMDALAREYAAIILKDPCAYCAAPSVELDHILPLSSEGHGGWDNLAPACRRCNAQKNDQPLLTFLAA